MLPTPLLYPQQYASYFFVNKCKMETKTQYINYKSSTSVQTEYVRAICV